MNRPVTRKAIDGDLRAVPTDKDFQVKLIDCELEVEAALQTQVDAIWRQAVQDQEKGLFDGTLLSVLAVSPQCVEVYQTQYRYYYAQSQETTLFESLNVRPLACSGILMCPEGLVMARRGSNVFLDTSKWELAPSGTMDGDSIGLDGTINVSNFILREMNEELGIEISTARIEGIIGLYEDTIRHNFDIVIQMTVNLSAAEIYGLFEHTGNDEYDLIEIVPIDRMATFIAEHETQFVPLSLQILRQHFDQ